MLQSMTQNVAVVAGASGLTGSYLRQVLEEDAFYDHCRYLTRQDNFANLSPERMAGATHLFCCLGTTIAKAGSQQAFRQVDFEYVVNFARAGKLAGASRMMLVSSVGADPRASTFYLRVKGEVEQALTGIGFEALHIFRPSVLVGRRPEKRSGEEWGIRLAMAFEWLLAGSLRKYRPMPAGVLAAAMAAAGERGAAGVHIHHFDEIHRLCGA